MSEIENRDRHTHISIYWIPLADVEFKHFIEMEFWEDQCQCRLHWGHILSLKIVLQMEKKSTQIQVNKEKTEKNNYKT